MAKFWCFKKLGVTLLCQSLRKTCLYFRSLLILHKPVVSLTMNIKHFLILLVLCVGFQSCIGSCDTPTSVAIDKYGNPVQLYIPGEGGESMITLTAVPDEINLFIYGSEQKEVVDHIFDSDNLSGKPDTLVSTLGWLSMYWAIDSKEVKLVAQPASDDSQDVAIRFKFGKELTTTYVIRHKSGEGE